MTAKKKLAGALGGVAALGATVALTAGTFSYFSDSATVNGASGTVRNGTLSLELLDGAADAPININNAAPGSTVLQTTLSFHNGGTLDGLLRVGFVADGANSEAFDKAVLISVKGVPGLVDNQKYTLEELNGDTVNLAPMYPDRYKSIPITVTIDPAAGNDLQGEEGSFTLKADLVQDSNGAPAPAFPAAPAVAP
jgi:hypothetical protein